MSEVVSRKLISRRVEAPNALEAIDDLYYKKGWTDGLPIVPPDEDRVLAMLSTSERDPAEVLGRFPPADGLSHRGKDRHKRRYGWMST